MPRNQRMNHLGDTVGLDTAAPPRPLYGPWVMASALSAAARTESGNLDHALRRRSEGWELPRPPPDSKPTSSGFSPPRQS
ncbi:hypothetical protein QFZ49_005652 [Streptomyces turgidiscabies]|uniref:Uncharacterized protein n=1 Tax=Streptomyces turgidiscabies TaxID=85558 RepID=A0ABU0RUL6_9ACTN|nr:hypothetical protein [Streptomyces turgidiscabies]